MRIYHLIGMVCLGLSQSNAWSQSNTQIYRALCDDSAKVFEALKQGYGEEPIVAGMGAPESGGGAMAVTVNPLTKTWTLVVVKGDRACVLGGGLDFTIRPADAKPR